MTASDVSVLDYVNEADLLTAEQVRKLPPGTMILVHKYSIRNGHVQKPATVSASYKGKKVLQLDNCAIPITKESFRLCYSVWR